jgi:hypothetical protein
MKSWNNTLFFLGAVALGLAHCGGQAVTGAGGPDAGGDGACLGLSTFDGGSRGTPTSHRAQATACSPNTSPFSDAGGGGACATDADCGDAGSFFSHCLRGHCAIDYCLVDSDCAATEVCSCSSAYYGGNVAVHPNLCVPSNCHVDTDCGAGGFCSPTAGYCGTVQGFYCHKLTDPCFNESTDCACTGTSFHSCVYSPVVGEFVCGGSVCAG